MVEFADRQVADHRARIVGLVEIVEGLAEDRGRNLLPLERLVGEPAAVDLVRHRAGTEQGEGDVLDRLVEQDRVADADHPAQLRNAVAVMVDPDIFIDDADDVAAAVGAAGAVTHAGEPVLVAIAGLGPGFLVAAAGEGRKRVDGLGIEAQFDQVRAGVARRPVGDIGGLLDRPREGRDQELLGRHALDPDPAVGDDLLELDREGAVAIVGLAEIVGARPRRLELGGVHRHRAGLGAAPVLPPRLDHADLGEERVLEPVVQDQEAGIVAVDDVVDIFGRLLGLGLVLGTARVEGDDLVGRHERLQHRRQRIVDHHRDAVVDHRRAAVQDRQIVHPAVIIIERPGLLVGDLAIEIADRPRLMRGEDRGELGVVHSSNLLTRHSSESWNLSVLVRTQQRQ